MKRVNTKKQMYRVLSVLLAALLLLSVLAPCAVAAKAWDGADTGAAAENGTDGEGENAEAAGPEAAGGGETAQPDGETGAAGGGETAQPDGETGASGDESAAADASDAAAVDADVAAGEDGTADDDAALEPVLARAYYDVVRGLQATCGAGVYYSEDGLDIAPYGLAVARLLDFDGDGTDELLCVCGKKDVGDDGAAVWRGEYRIYALRGETAVLLYSDELPGRTEAGVSDIQLIREDGRLILHVPRYTADSERHVYGALYDGRWIEQRFARETADDGSALYSLNGRQVDEALYRAALSSWAADAAVERLPYFYTPYTYDENTALTETNELLIQLRAAVLPAYSFDDAADTSDAAALDTLAAGLLAPVSLFGGASAFYSANLSDGELAAAAAVWAADERLSGGPACQAAFVDGRVCLSCTAESLNDWAFPLFGRAVDSGRALADAAAAANEEFAGTADEENKESAAAGGSYWLAPLPAEALPVCIRAFADAAAQAEAAGGNADARTNDSPDAAGLPHAADAPVLVEAGVQSGVWYFRLPDGSAQTDRTAEIENLYELCGGLWYVLFAPLSLPNGAVAPLRGQASAVVRRTDAGWQLLFYDGTGGFLSEEELRRYLPVEREASAFKADTGALSSYPDEVLSLLEAQLDQDGGLNGAGLLDAVGFMEYAATNLAPGACYATDGEASPSTADIRTAAAAAVSLAQRLAGALSDRAIEPGRAPRTSVRIDISGIDWAQPVTVRFPAGAADAMDGADKLLIRLGDERHALLVSRVLLAANDGLTVTLTLSGDACSVRLAGADGKAVTAFDRSVAVTLPAGSEKTVVAQNGSAVFSRCDAQSGTVTWEASRSARFTISEDAAPLADTAALSADEQAAAVFAVSQGLMRAGGGSFSLNESLSRYELCYAAVQLCGGPGDTPSCPCADVPEASIWTPYVATALANGWISARGDGSFDGRAAVTRGELLSLAAVLLTEQAGFRDIPDAGAAALFADGETLPAELAPAVSLALQTGLLTGGGVLAPDGAVLRREAAVLFRELASLLYPSSSSVPAFISADPPAAPVEAAPVPEDTSVPVDPESETWYRRIVIAGAALLFACAVLVFVLLGVTGRRKNKKEPISGVSASPERNSGKN